MNNASVIPISEITWHCRQATMNDMDRIVEISKQALPPAIKHPKRMVAQMLAGCNSGYVVATVPKTGEIVGFVGITCAYGYCCIYPMAVDSRFRRLGAATAMLTFLKVKCESYGGEYVSTVIQERDVSMQLLLRATGFICDKVTPDGYRFIWRTDWLGGDLDTGRTEPAVGTRQELPHQCALASGVVEVEIPFEEFAHFAGCVVESVRRHVTDEGTLNKIACEVEYLLGGAAKPEMNFTITA